MDAERAPFTEIVENPVEMHRYNRNKLTKISVYSRLHSFRFTAPMLKTNET